MPQPNPLAFVVTTAAFSLISSSMLSAYQPPKHAKRVNTPKNTANQAIAFIASIQQVADKSLWLSKSYTPAQINYFLEVALKSEYGESEPTIKKWDGDINIKVLGSPTPEDIRTLQSVIDELNTLVSGTRLQLERTTKKKSQGILHNNPNLEIYFVPESQFAQYEPNYQPPNYGFFWTWWNDNYAIHRSRVLISTVGVTQQERSHLVREELTQALGLMGDSEQYSDSIFYQGWTDTTHYAEIDKALIEMLYRPEIRPGMTKSQVLNVFQTLNAKKKPTPQCRQNVTQPALDFSVAPSCETR